MEFRNFEILRSTVYHLAEQILRHDALEGIATSSANQFYSLDFSNHCPRPCWMNNFSWKKYSL